MIDLFYDCYSVLSKVYSDGAFIKQAISTTNVEPLNKSKTVKICYGVLDKDIELDHYIAALSVKSPKLKIRVILKIALYCIKHLEKKPYAVIDGAVELTKKLGKGANAGFVNAVLRKFVSETIPLPTDKIDRYSVKYSYPRFAVEKLIACYGEKEAERIMAFDEEKTFVRFETGGEEYLEKNGYEFEKTPFNELFSVKRIIMNDDFGKGVFTFQSIGSVAICEIVGSGEELFDACAAPGGKSVYLADRFKKVVSEELHEHRAELILSYVRRMKKKNVEVFVGDSREFRKDLAERFDAVLCDVPCSGYGTVKSNPDVKLNRSEESVKALAETQYAILSNCSKYVSSGGSIVYSTCTLFDDENDEVVGRFLSENDSFEKEIISSPLGHINKKYGLQFLPDVSMGAGFYCAKLKRIK